MSEPSGSAHKQQSKNYAEDEGYQDSLCKLLVDDIESLNACASELKAADFKPQNGMQYGHGRWIVADRALNYFQRHKQPAGKLIRTEVLHFAKQTGLGERQTENCEEYLRHLKTIPLPPREAIIDKVTRYAEQRGMADALEDLSGRQGSGVLTIPEGLAQWQKLAAKFGHLESVNGHHPQYAWPKPLGKPALRGLAGEFIDLVAPHTEADPAALLVQFLIGFGSIIGRSPHWKHEATEHHLNLFGVIVGATGEGRKGTAWDHVRTTITASDPSWQIITGLSSGEGLIHRVRDATLENILVKKGKSPHYEEVLRPGEEDKRLLVIETEFAKVLQACERENNTLSAILRQAWDTGDLNSLVLHNNYNRATGAHISIVGHITPDELHHRLTDIATCNGFGNRFLWVCATRSKPLPEGGSLDPDAKISLATNIRDAVVFSRQVGEMKKSKKAKALWKEKYTELSMPHPGIAGALMARGAPLVLRLACIYALLDRCSYIKTAHLLAALEIWRYCQESVRFIFGGTLGDLAADEIAQGLRKSPNGLTRTEISSGLFQGNKSSAEIDQALEVLRRHGLAQMQKEVGTPGQKRPTERWTAIRSGIQEKA